MEYNKMTVDELIAESIRIKHQIAGLKAERLAIKEAIKARNAEKAVLAKIGKLSNDERKALGKMYGSGDVVVTPGPARLNLKGG